MFLFRIALELFLRSTAWLLQLNIVLHQNVTGYPEKTISGNMQNENIPCDGPKLHLGYLLNKHYQSLLPRVDVPEFLTGEQEPEEEIEENVCPVCKKIFPKVLLHIKKAKHCKTMATDKQI